MPHIKTLETFWSAAPAQLALIVGREGESPPIPDFIFGEQNSNIVRGI